MNIIYGIPNCDTIKKAQNFLTLHNITFKFINYREQQIPEKTLISIIKKFSIQALINKRSTTYRNLTDTEKQSPTIDLIKKYPTLIPRPVLITPTQTLIGFNQEKYLSLIQK